MSDNKTRSDDLKEKNSADFVEPSGPEQATVAPAERRVSGMLKNAGPKPKTDPTLSDMRKFHRATDWVALWQRFFCTISPSGRHTYETVRQFAKAIAKNERQLRFVEYCLGPRIDPLTGVEAAPYYAEDAWVTPQDWPEKRRTGGWLLDNRLRKEVERKRDALNALFEAGNQVWAPTLLQLHNLEQTIDEHFTVGQFLPDLSVRENYARLQLYLQFKGRLLKLKQKVWIAFAQSRGVDYNQPQSFTEIVQMSMAIMDRAGAAGKRISRKDNVMLGILDMTIEKARKHRIPLSPEMEQKIIEVESKAEPGRKNRRQPGLPL